MRRWYGPYEVTGTMKNAVKLLLPTTMKCHPVFNVSYIRPAHEAPNGVHTYDRPPPEHFIDGQPAYAIRAVLSKRKKGKGFEYEVAWDGYPDDENTWIPRWRLIMDAPDLVKKFDDNSVY